MEYFRLRELSEEYPIILVDACALFGVYNNGNSSKSARMSAKFFSESQDRNIDIYTTERVAHEYLTVNGGNFACKPGDDLIKSLRSRGRIIQPNKEQQEAIGYYSYKHSEKIKKKLKKLNRPLLSENDLELLLLGTFLSESENTAIITNDRGIHIGAEYILSRERDLNLGSFMRVGANKFLNMAGKKYKAYAV